MPEELDFAKIQEVLENGVAKAQDTLSDPEKVNALLAQIETKVKELPDIVSSGLINLPVMAQMVKSYITKEYTEISPKVVASVVSAFLYLVKKKDLIRDDIPLLGYLDDIAVVALAIHINEDELRSFQAWQEEHPTLEA